MLYLFGNCQMEFLGTALQGRGIATDYRPLSSPLTLGRDRGVVPPSLQILQRRFDIERFMHGRTLRNQFQLLTPEDPPAEAVVLNLFHENQPLFSHPGEECIFFCNPAAWEELPALKQWMEKSCQHIRPNPLRYLQRFTRLLEALVKRRPRTPLLLVTRLFHFPAFGPAPYSYLEEWGELQFGLQEALEHWLLRFPNLHVLDMNRVFAGIWNRAGPANRRIEAHCPFLRVRGGEEAKDVGAGDDGEDAAAPCLEMTIERDLEHVGSLWPVMAAKVAAFLEQGEVRYTPEEQAPPEWGQPWQGGETPGEEELLRWLRSGSNYAAGRAVAAMLLQPEQDRTELLLQAAQEMPVCHNVLHMIDNYSRIQKNHAVVSWCEAHGRIAGTFNANGPLYKRQYLERLAHIAKRATLAARAVA